MRVALGGRHPGVAKHLLDDADMHALLDQQSGSSVPGIVNPGIPNPGLGPAWASSLRSRRQGAGCCILPPCPGRALLLCVLSC